MGRDCEQGQPLLARQPIFDQQQRVIAYESGNWDQLPSDFPVALYEACYRHSLKWSKESMQAMYE